MEEDDAELEEMIAGLRGRDLQQVRRYVAVLARMRRDLTPSARIHMIKELGWHLGPTRETGERAEITMNRNRLGCWKGPDGS
jgi:hypothetical protein